MLDVRQFKYLVVRPALDYLKIGVNDQALNLVTGTALVESRLTYLRQLPDGPALGLFQMEPATHEDIWNNFLRYRKPLCEKMSILTTAHAPKYVQLQTNLLYAAAMCRVHYFRRDEPLPAPDDAIGLAQYWKRWYNTSKGAGGIKTATPFFQQAIQA